MLSDNLILWTDSYKLTHWIDYPEGTQFVSSYFESRPGAEYDSTLFFGLQAIIKKLEGAVVTQADVDEAAMVAAIHFGNPDVFNRSGWEHIVNAHGGKLPVIIKAVPEGTRVPVGNVLMTVENTDPENTFWLTNALESYLTHVWYPMTVATKSRAIKDSILAGLVESGTPEKIDFMLQDFGYRGATGNEAAGLGGAAHLVNFMGTDTLMALATAVDFYKADLESLGFSVVATEHSIMTAKGRDGEMEVLDKLLRDHPTGILSVVGDSYDINNFTQEVINRKDIITAREGVFVLRPDSPTPEFPEPEDLFLDLVQQLWDGYGGVENDKGYKVLDDHVRVLWGDGINHDGIEKIIWKLIINGFSVDNVACFGMGGGLLQKVNRDTQRCAFKSSAQFRDGRWFDVKKEPLDTSKTSKAGRLKLIEQDGKAATVRREEPGENLLKVVFENGELHNFITFDEVRANSLKDVI